METRIDEIASRIYRFSTFVPEVAPPQGLTFNQFLIDADEPLLFHCGQRQLFPLVSAAAARVVDLKRIRWITFSHVEADECGSMNEWLAAAPQATAAHGKVGCNIWLSDQALRPPRALADGEVIDLGGKRVRRIDTPHLPHCWDAGLLYEETTGTLFCSDLFTHTGNGPALTDGDIVGPSLALEKALRFVSAGSNTGRQFAASRSYLRARWQSCMVRRSRAMRPRHSVSWPDSMKRRSANLSNRCRSWSCPRQDGFEF